jgi:hypothetical protein
MIDTNSLEWKLRKLGENVDMLKRACEDNRLHGIRKGGVHRPALGRRSNWWWQN